MGSLDTIFIVPPNDDPSTTWGSVSWELNGYQPLAVGNIYVVYTRTAGMYVALEVTNVDMWSQYFEFDYIIQTNGTNVFDDEPSSVIYNSGEMSMAVDSLYFNYFEGMMGSDTLNMDVMISSNEGTNFGSESAWVDGNMFPEFTDPSLLHFYSVNGSLDTVTRIICYNFIC